MQEKIFFVVLAIIFIYAVLNMVALARNVMAHGITRAELADINQLERDIKSGDHKSGR